MYHIVDDSMSSPNGGNVKHLLRESLIYLQNYKIKIFSSCAAIGFFPVFLYYTVGVPRIVDYLFPNPPSFFLLYIVPMAFMVFVTYLAGNGIYRYYFTHLAWRENRFPFDSSIEKFARYAAVLVTKEIMIENPNATYQFNLTDSSFTCWHNGLKETIDVPFIASNSSDTIYCFDDHLEIPKNLIVRK